MSSAKFMDDFQQSLKTDYINTLKTVPSLRDALIKTLVKYTDQLPSVSKKPYQNVINVLFQLDFYDQVSPSVYHYNTILQQLMSLFEVILKYDVGGNKSSRNSMYKLNNNSTDSLLSKAKKDTVWKTECNLMFKIFNAQLLKKFSIDEKDLDYYKDINKMISIFLGLIERDTLNEIVVKCISMNFEIFVLELEDDDDKDFLDEILLNKKMINRLITILISRDESKAALKLILESKNESKEIQEFVKRTVIGCEPLIFDITEFDFMIQAKEQNMFQHFITNNVIENRILNYIIYFTNDQYRLMNYERLNVILEMISYIKNKEVDIVSGLKPLKTLLEKYLAGNKQSNKTSLYKLSELVIIEISSIEEIFSKNELQNLADDNYTEPDYTLWSPLWGEAITERLSTSEDKDFIQWVANNTSIETSTEQNFQSAFDFYIFNKFQKQVTNSAAQLVKTFSLTKELQKRLVVHNMGMLLTTELFDIKYLINDQTKTVIFIIKYKHDDDVIIRDMLDFSCSDESGLLHKMDVNTVKILRIQDWKKYMTESKILRFKILMESGKKYVFDVEFYLYLNKLFTKEADIDLETFEQVWNAQKSIQHQKIDAGYDSLVIHLNKLKKYNLQVLNKDDGCFYVKASLQTIDLQQVDILSIMTLNNQLSWDIQVSNNIIDTEMREIINKSFMGLFQNI